MKLDGLVVKLILDCCVNRAHPSGKKTEKILLEESDVGESEANRQSLSD